MIHERSVFQEILTWEQAPCNELRVGLLGRMGHAKKQIMLYGPTQVGKTTLLMNMMGVLPEKQAHLSILLRGGSASGNSATSTAIVYNKWNESVFGLAVSNIGETPPDPEKLSEEAFGQKIVALNHENRNAISADTHSYKDIFHYYIPISYFQEPEWDEEVQYIDLPGFGEKNEVMRERANKLIEQYASQVDGAIAVVKANNTVNLEQEYYYFLSRIPKKRRILVVSHAVKNCIEVKELLKGRTVTNEEDEVKLWREIAGKHRELLGQSLITQDASPNELLVFPVELEQYLDEFFPDISGVFRHSRRFLQEQVQKIPVKSTFAACEEALDQHIENLRENIVFIEQQHQKKIAKIHTANEELQSLLKLSQKYAADNSCHNETLKVRATARYVHKLLEESKKKALLHPSDIAECVRLIKPSYINLANEMYQNMERKWISTHSDIPASEVPPTDRKMYEELRAILLPEGKAIIDRVEFGRFYVKRDGWILKKFGSKSYDYVNNSVTTIARRIRDRLTEVINTWEQNAINKLQEQMQQEQHKQLQLLLTQRQLQYHIDSLEEERLDLMSEKAAVEQQMVQLENSKSNIRSIFVKHFYLKKKELEKRIAEASTPQLKAALMLVLSTIYTNMKPHIEEEERKR